MYTLSDAMVKLKRKELPAYFSLWSLVVRGRQPCYWQISYYPLPSGFHMGTALVAEFLLDSFRRNCNSWTLLWRVKHGMLPQSEWEFEKEYLSNTTSPTFTNSGWVINILLPSVLFSLLLLLSHTILRDIGLWEGDCGTRKSDLLCRRHYESSTFSVFPSGVWPRGPRSASQHSHITNWANRG